MLAIRRGLFHIVAFERRMERLRSINLVTMEMNFRSEFQMQPNKSFKYVPGLRPSTGHKNAAHFYAA